jgi:hypothetical protein
MGTALSRERFAWWMCWVSGTRTPGADSEGGGHRLLGKDCASGGRVHQGLGYDFLHVAIDDCSRVA